MQLVSNDSHSEDVSESEPILSRSEISQRSESSLSSCEITSAGANCPLPDRDLENLNADETCHLVNTDQPQCRICLDNEGEDLISPCHCKGTQKYVHRSCLDSWRSTKEGFAFAHCTECRALFILRANVPSNRWWLRLKFQFLVARDHAFIFVIVQLIVAFLGVLVYKFYGEELREMFGYEEHPYGFYTMAGNWCLFFLGLCSVSSHLHAKYVYKSPFVFRFLIGIMAEIYPGRDLILSVSFPTYLSQNAVLAIVLVGLLYGFFIAIICGQRISERHYHILAKQELTKEFVVEDRDTSKNAPELDPSHVTELRMLGLY